MKILIIGDQKGSREGLASLFEYEGYGVAIAGDIMEAREILGQTLFDLVITDLEMSDHVGLELVNFIRFTHPASCIVMLTADATDQDLSQKEASQASVFLEKPINPSRLLQMVEKFKKKKLNDRPYEVVC
jgi:CheY-like chemotaxis protein